MRIGVCDDNRIFGETVINFIVENIKRLGEKIDEIIYFTSGNEVIQYKKELDLLFLDVEMDGMDGFETSRRIRLIQPNCIIAFLTFHSEMVYRGFHVKAYRYLLKDNYKIEIAECLRDFFWEYRQSDIEVMLMGQPIKIKMKSIMHICAKHNGTEIWGEDGVYQSSNTLFEWMEILNKDMFVRSHKRAIVNITYIDRIDKYAILFNGDKVEVSRRNMTELKRNMMRYTMNYINRA